MTEQSRESAVSLGFNSVNKSADEREAEAVTQKALDDYIENLQIKNRESWQAVKEERQDDTKELEQAEEHSQ